MFSSHQPRLKKRFGQHLMISPEIIEEIVENANIQPTTRVIEIGPGTGLLTDVLITKSRQVQSIEIDEDMVVYLNNRYRNKDNIEIIKGDILQIDMANVSKGEPYVVVANLPYSSGSKIIRYLLESPHSPERMVVTLQKEVASNLTAEKGKESLLSIAVGIYATVKLVRIIKPEHFDPPPKVDSAVVNIVRRAQPLIPTGEIPDLFKYVRAGFSSKRKQLRNSLASNLRISPELMLESLLAAQIDPRRRPETITISEWHKLMKIHGNLDND